MRALQETTKWESPNWIYITNDTKEKLIAFVSDGKLTRFKKPLFFDTKKRSFKEVPNRWIAE